MYKYRKKVLKPSAIQVQAERLSDSDNLDLSNLEIEVKHEIKYEKKNVYSEFQEAPKQIKNHIIYIIYLFIIIC